MNSIQLCIINLQTYENVNSKDQKNNTHKTYYVFGKVTFVSQNKASQTCVDAPNK
jgi:hypothetical protein